MVDKISFYGVASLPVHCSRPLKLYFSGNTWGKFFAKRDHSDLCIISKNLQYASIYFMVCSFPNFCKSILFNLFSNLFFCKDFNQVTIMFSELCGLNYTNNLTQVAEIVCTMNEIFMKFDKIIDEFKVYKVRSYLLNLHVLIWYVSY